MGIHERIAIRNERIRKRNEAQKQKEANSVSNVTSVITTIPNIIPHEGPLRLEICIHCHNYQKRLCWMLSSILQQQGEKPDILVSISYLPNSGNPTTESVIKLFREKGLDILDIPLTAGQESNRAIPRNIRAKETKADWILFADSDLVYEPLFFEDVRRQLESDKFKNETRVIGADRYSLQIPFCVKFFEEDKREYPCVIKNVADIPKDWPVQWKHGSGTCAGYFQLANTAAIKNKGGVYSGRKSDVWRATRSDRQFRVHMGGRVPMDVLKLFHLNHDRGGPEIQR